jgi:hypothetical protein
MFCTNVLKSGNFDENITIMSDIIDIVHNLSFQVTGDKYIQDTIKKMQESEAAIRRNISAVDELNKIMSTKTDRSEIQFLQESIDKRTKSIMLQKQALQQKFETDKVLQAAVRQEIGLVTQLNNKIQQLTRERAVAMDVAAIRNYTNQIKAAQNEMATLLGMGAQGANGNGGAGGGVLGGLFGGGGGLGRQLLQGTLLGFGIGSGFGLISRAVSGIIEFAQAELNATAHAKELIEANDALASSFSALADSIQKAAEQEQALVEAEIRNSTGIDLSVNAYKQKEEALKAIGAINGKVGNAELDQLVAAQQTRQAELQDLQEKYKRLVLIEAVLDAARSKAGLATGGKFNIGGSSATSSSGAQGEAAIDVINSSILSNDDKARLITAIHEAQEKKGNILDVLDTAKNKAKTDTAAGDTDISNKQNEILNADRAFQAKLDEQARTAKIKLNKELADEDEKYRELKGKEDIASVDKIVADVNAKYKQLVDENTRKETEELNTFPDGDPRRAAIAKKYGLIAGDINRNRDQDISNQTFEFNRSRFFGQESDMAGEAAANAAQAKFAAGYGVPDYDKMAAAQEADRQAQLANASKAFNELSEKYRQSGEDTTTIEKQYAQQVEQIEQESYSKRLQLASDYFQQLSQRITQIGTYLLTNNVTAILSGRGSSQDKNRRIAMAQARNQISTNQQLVPGLQGVVSGDQDAAINASGADATSKAVDQTMADQQKLATAQQGIAEGEQKLHDLKIQQLEEEITAFQSMVDTAVKGYQTIAQARQADLNRQVEVDTQRVDLAYKLAERGNTQALAQQQKALDEAEKQKRQQALTDQEINAALTVSNMIVAVTKSAAEGGVAAPATIALALAAIGTGIAEAVALGQAQKQSFAKGGYTGDGGKYDEAGTVHKGEFVFTKEQTAKYRPLFEAIHTGQLEAPPVAYTRTFTHGDQYATRNELRAIGDKLDVLIGKEVSVRQSVSKAGVYQIVEEQQRAHAVKWKN